MRGIGRQQQTARHHAEVLIAIRKRLGVAMVAHVAEAAFVEELGNALFGVESLGVKQVGNDARLVVDKDFAADEAFAVGG